MQIQSLPFSLWNSPWWLRTESRGLACKALLFTFRSSFFTLGLSWTLSPGILLFLWCPRAFAPAVGSPGLPDAYCIHSLASCGHLLNCHLIQRPLSPFPIFLLALTHYTFISFSLCVLECNFLVKRDFVSCWMNLQHPDKCLACPSPSFICWMNIERSNLDSSWWGPGLLLEPCLPSHWSAPGLGPWDRLLLLTPFSSAWTDRVGVCVCLPYIWVQAGRVLPAVNHHFWDHACAYDPGANHQALQQPP